MKTMNLAQFEVEELSTVEMTENVGGGYGYSHESSSSKTSFGLGLALSLGFESESESSSRNSFFGNNRGGLLGIL